MSRLTDTLLTPDGELFSGVINVFVERYSDLSAYISQGARYAAFRVEDGILDITLSYNTNSCYVVQLQQDKDKSWTEYWVVADSETPLRLQDVRVQAPIRTTNSITESELTDPHSRLAYQRTYWDDAICSVGTLSQGNIPADPITFGASGIRPMVYGFGVNEDMDGSLQLSHRYKEGTNISFHIHWTPTSSAAGNVKWQLDYYWLNVGDAAGASTSVTVEAPAGGTAWAHKITGFTAFVGTGKKISSVLVFKLKRIAASANEYGADAALLSVDAHFEIDTPGSDTELVK